MDNNGSNAALLSASDLCRAHLKSEKSGGGRSPDVPKPILEEAENGTQGSRSKAFSNSSSNR